MTIATVETWSRAILIAGVQASAGEHAIDLTILTQTDRRFVDVIRLTVAEAAALRDALAQALDDDPGQRVGTLGEPGPAPLPKEGL